MGINTESIVTNHSAYPNARFGWKFNPDAQNSAVADTIQKLLAGSSLDSANCRQYGQRWACARDVTTISGVVTTIAGLDHREDDPAFEPPTCDEFELGTTAADVFTAQTNDNLKAYVKGVIEVAQQLMANTTATVVSDFIAAGTPVLDLASKRAEISIEVQARVFSKIACFGRGDFKKGNIYAFAMDADPAVSTVLFNGHNFDLNGASLNLDDNQLPGEDKSIVGLFASALGDAAVGNYAYVNYRWDDPTTDADNVANFFEDGVVPGTSCKKSYIEVADLNALLPDTPVETPEWLFIFGSGTYPEPEEDDGDGACAIAGTGHTSQNTLLNLFLIASVLLSVVFLRKRA
jgi:hypothetical protein